MAGGKGGGRGGRGAKPSSHRKGAQQGSGGKQRKSLQGKGPTPRAEQRYSHPAARRAAARGSAARQSGSGGGRSTTVSNDPGLVTGRNPVVEALRAGVPSTALYLADGIDRDDRVTEAVRIAGDGGVAPQQVSRPELDRLTRGAPHQGLALRVAAFDYTHPDDLLSRARSSGQTPLLVALDGVTDPHNLGAIARSVAAFGGHGILVPERRAASVTAGAWKSSAGALARVPVARAPNLARALSAYQADGVFAVGLSGSGEVPLASLELASEPVVLVVGSEGGGLSRLVRERCDLNVHVPMASGTESLNAAVAASVALYEVSRHRS